MGQAAGVMGMKTPTQFMDTAYEDYLKTIFQPADVQRLGQYSQAVAQDFINTGQWQGGLMSELGQTFTKYLTGLDKGIFQRLLPEPGTTFMSEISQKLTPKEQALKRKIPVKVLR